MPTRTKVLFLCIGNACRSQMAEAIAKHVAKDVIEASSAGLATRLRDSVKVQQSA